MESHGDNYVKLLYGLKDGQIVHIREAARGLSCDCVCPVCGDRLEARKGERNRYHFAHYTQTKCPYAAETAVHLAAKEILATEGGMWLPEFVFTATAAGGGGRQLTHSETLETERVMRFHSVHIEYRTEDVVPDLIVTDAETGNEVFIEIYVSHKVNAAKLEKLRRLGVAVIEIDLHNVAHNLDPDTLHRLLVEKSSSHEEKKRKKWIAHPGMERVRQELQRKVDESIALWERAQANAGNRKPARLLRKPTLSEQAGIPARFTKEDGYRLERAVNAFVRRYGRGPSYEETLQLWQRIERGESLWSFSTPSNKTHQRTPSPSSTARAYRKAKDGE